MFVRLCVITLCVYFGISDCLSEVWLDVLFFCWIYKPQKLNTKCVCVCVRRRWRLMRTTVLSWPGGSVRSGLCASSPDCLSGESRAALASSESRFVIGIGTLLSSVASEVEWVASNQKIGGSVLRFSSS